MKQLKKLDFNPNGWGRTEVNELCNILMPDEEIEELVNGYYEAGFALLVATKERVLLVDKKPLNYLTVEDMRFDMISEFDYSHRLVGARVSISSGYKNLEFTSLNQSRLRRLLNYVQCRKNELKKTLHNHQENQQQHLEQMNEQLRQYLETAQKSAKQMNESLQQPTPVIVAPAYNSREGYMLPQPVSQTETLRDQSSFERAAAASVGIVNPELVETPSVLRKIVLTPQQVGLAAVRRVAPVVRAYSRATQSTDNPYVSGASVN
jgi:hypothetical protein